MEVVYGILIFASIIAQEVVQRETEALVVGYKPLETRYNRNSVR